MISAFQDLFPNPRILESLQNGISEYQQVYLVGGAVRDMLLQRNGKDLDFVADGDVLRLARKVADEIGAAFYVMDMARQTARLIYEDEAGHRWHLDFSALRGDTILEDLHRRDFTINAIAIDVRDPGSLIDPMKGSQDIKDGWLRMCSPNSFTDDPLRVIRAVRLAAEIGLRITPPTIAHLKEASLDLGRVSIERQRDELFHILQSKQAAAGIRTGFALDVFDTLLPEVKALQGEVQGPPHVHDVFEHTLALVTALPRLYDLLVEPYVEEKVSNLIFGMAVTELGRFRRQLAEHFSARLNPDRSRFGLLMLAGLLHDAAKPYVRTHDQEGRMHFYNHDGIAGDMAEQHARDLALSIPEVDYLKVLVRQHMRIHWLAKSGENVSKRAIYRYFRDLGAAGVDLVLLSLADKTATYGVTITPAEWQKELTVCRQLLDAWFNMHEEIIQPKWLVNGTDILDELNLQPGKIVGELLEELHEAQAIGQVQSREQGLLLARNLLESKSIETTRKSDGH